MENLEPTSFVLLLIVFAVLMAASAVLSQASERAGVPVVLLFLSLGMLAGREGIGRLSFENYPLCFNLSTAALVLILPGTRAIIQSFADGLLLCESKAGLQNGNSG